ncbi:MAG: hypothetical protein AAGJ52_13415, partial [Pseudomonadota bacterium]
MSDFPEYHETRNPSESVTPSDLPVVRGPNGFETSPLAVSGAGLGESSFRSAYTSDAGYAQIYAENNVSDTFVDDVISLIDPPQSDLANSGAIKSAGYEVRVFVSKDDSYLRESFETTQPAANELCIFLEDNSTDIFSNASSYIKAGERFRSDMASKAQITQDISGQIVNYDFENQAPEHNVQFDFSESQLQELIATGEIRNVSREFLITLFQAVNFGTQILSSAYLFLGDGLLSITQGLRDLGKFSDDSWDPDSEFNSKQDPSEFEPVLFPLSQELISLMTLGGDTVLDSAEDLMRKSLQSHGKLAVDALSSASALPGLSVAVPEQVTQSIQLASEKLEELLTYLMNQSRKILSAYIHIGTQWMNAVNAFLCGLWNAAVEAVLGLIDLLGFLLKGLGHAGEAINDAQSLVPQAQELADELLQTILNTDWLGIAQTAIDAAISKISSTNPLDLVGSVSIERISYYTGAAVGFIAEMAIGFGTGGTSSAASVSTKLAKFGQAGEGFAKFLASGLNKLLSGSKTLVGKAILLVQACIRILKR